MRLRLVTPDRSLFDEETVSVSIPTSEGEVTILPGHAPFTAIVVAGIARMKKTNEAIEEVAVSDGFLHVTKDGNITVLTDTAERGQELDVDAIEQAKERAKEVMKKAAAQDDVAFAMATAGVERELARLKLAHKHRSRSKTISSTAVQQDH
ncbi:MAG: ATP synthase F1 subunit epsilon [Patescibacteria group bacterium]